MRAPGTPILFVSQSPPWPRESGGSIRTWYVLEALARAHPITLVTTEPAADRLEGARHALGALCERVRFLPDSKSRAPLALARTAVLSLVRGEPLVVRHNRNAGIARAVREELLRGPAPLLHLNHVDTVQYVEEGELARAVIDTHNLYFDYYARVAALDATPWSRALHRRESRALKRYELAAFARAARVLVCSESERRTLAALDPRIDVRVAPNGADCERFQPSGRDPFENPPDLAFVGDMGYGPNDDAARFFASEVMPRLRERVPGARFLAIGKHPSAALRALAEGRDDVVVTGFVEDVREHVRRARACVVPLRYGAGTRLKVLEAFALGMPTVSTRLGAEGIDCADGAEILLADGPEELAQAAARVLTERALHARLAAAARKAAVLRFDWRAIGEIVRAAYEDLPATASKR